MKIYVKRKYVVGCRRDEEINVLSIQCMKILDYVGIVFYPWLYD